MFCENCGNKIGESHKFCTKCGNSYSSEKSTKRETVNFESRWWLRLVKAIYVFLYIPLPFALFGAWVANKPYSTYSSYSGYYTYGSYEEAFWYSLLTLAIWIAVLRLLKIAVLYVANGLKPEWKREFRRLY